MTSRSFDGCLWTAALAAGFMLVLLLAPAPAAAADFGQDTLITSNSYKQEYPACAVGPNGYIYVIWQDDRNSPGSTYDIYFARSTDNGSTFSNPVRVDDATAGTDQIYPQLALDSSGKLHAVWSDYRSGVNYRVYYSSSSDNGSTWSSNVMVNYSAAGGQMVPSVTTDAGGNVYVVWDDGRSGNHVYFSKSTDGGSTFSAAAKVDQSGTAARFPWICYSPNGNLTVVWHDSRNTNWDIFLVTSNNGGAGFSSEVNVTKNTTSNSQMYPKVASDSGSNLHLVWDDNRFGNFGVYYAYSSDGLSFTTALVNDTDTGITVSPPEPPGLAVDSNGAAHVVWQDKRGGSAYTRIYYAGTTAQATFGSNARVDNATGANCYYPLVAADANNVPSVVWEDIRNPSLDIFYDRPQNAPPYAPDLNSPGNDTWVNSSKPTFTWTFKDVNSSDTQSAYQLQLDNSSGFGSIDYDSGAAVSSAASHTPSADISDGIYYWRVRTRDAGGVWGPYSAPMVVKIDTVAPSAGAPSDGGVWSISSTINWTWNASGDALSGVAGYYLSIGTTAGGAEVLADQWTAAPNFTYTGGTNGTTYYAKIRARDNASNNGTYGANSDGITVDVSIPAAGSPADDGQYVNTSVIKWSWLASEDFPSGIAGYYVSVGTSSGQDDIIKEYWVTVPSYTYASGQNGVTYYAKVRAKDNATNVGDFGGNSDGITVDTSIPTSYIPQDNGTYSNSTTLVWSWPPSWDLPSGIKGYYVSVGTSYGGNDTVDGCFTTGTSFILSGAADGKTYYCRIYSVDNAGNIGPYGASSDGITVDTTPPSDITVADEGPYSTNSTSLRAGWTSSFDDVSGIADYQYRIGTTAGGGEMVDWTSAGQALSVARRGLSLQNAATYYFSVRARNGAGLWSVTAVSEGVMVDTTIPSATKPSGPGNYSTSSSITWSWNASEDLGSGISGYYITVGTSPGGAEVLRDAFTPDNFYTFAPALNGKTYYARIRAADKAGNIGGLSEESAGVLVDISIPEVAAPMDAGAYSTSPNITFNWSPAADAPSGIAGYYLSVGTTSGGSDVLADMWTVELSWNLTVEPGRTYYAKVRAVDNAGNEGPYSASSDGITVDLSPPMAPAVYGGGYMRDAASLTLSWSVSFDPETPVVEYRYAFGTAPGGSEVVAWTSAGMRLSQNFSGLGLINGQTYYLSVQARNAAGLWSEVATGAALMLDTVSPAASAPAAAGAFANASIVTWAWEPSVDAESGVAGYYVYIGTSQGGSDVIDGAWTARASYSFMGGQSGVRYFASVAAQDRAGNIGPRSLSSGGVTVDTSVPATYPAVAASQYSMYASIDWNWTASQDSPSGVAGYYVSVGTFPGGEDAVSYQWTAQPSYHFSGGQDGMTYFIKVRARDNAGNLGDNVLGTGGVTIDLQAPSGTLAIEGGAATTARRAVMLSITSNDTDAAMMQVSSDPNMAGAHWEPFAQSRSWMLSDGDGTKTVYVRLMDRAGHVSAVFSASVTLDTAVAPFKLESSAGTSTGQTATDISGTVESGSEVFVNGHPVTVGAGGSFRQTVTLEEGSNVITVTVVDPAGNSQTLTKSVWRSSGLVAVGGGGDSTLVVLLFVVVIVIMLAVLVMTVQIQRRLAAHLRTQHGAAAAAPAEEPPEEAAEEQRPARKAKAALARAPERKEAGEDMAEKAAKAQEAPEAPAAAEGWTERPPEEAAPEERAPTAPWTEEAQAPAPAEAGEGFAPSGEEAPPEQPPTAPAETTSSILESLAAAMREPSPLAEEAPAPRAHRPVTPREGDVIIKSDGTEAAPEPRLVSEWSPETGKWAPVTEEGAAGQTGAQEQAQGASQMEEGPGVMAPEPTRALDDFARSARGWEQQGANLPSAREAPPPPLPTAGSGGRRSAKEIYEVLYGKRAGPSVAAASAAPKGAAPGTQPAAPGGPPTGEERKLVGKVRCSSCKGIIPIYSTERPLQIQCPSCGLKGQIK